MVVKAFILSGQEGVDYPFWDRLYWYEDTTLGGEFGQQSAIPGVNAGHNRRLIMSELLVVRQLSVELRDGYASDNAPGDCQQDHAANELSSDAFKSGREVSEPI